MEKWKVKDCAQRGRIERVEYRWEGYEKYANVYLPYGYDQKDKYDILYLMHGGGGNPDAWLDHAPTKNILDHMMMNNECGKMIVVFPTYYT